MGKGYFWKNEETKKWFYRERKDSFDWKGPFSSRLKAKQARDSWLAGVWKETRIVASVRGVLI